MKRPLRSLLFSRYSLYKHVWKREKPSKGYDMSHTCTLVCTSVDSAIERKLVPNLASALSKTSK